MVAPLEDESVPAVERLGLVFGRLLGLGPDQRQVVRDVVQAAGRVADSGELGQFARTATEIGEFYPTDPGVLAALLMNRIHLHPNEAVFLPAGNLHAYLSGGGVEIMANSDNVMRGGLTPKHVDVAELLRVVDFTPGFAGLTAPEQTAPGVWRYPTPALEFALWRLELTGDPVEIPARGTGRVALVTAGAVTLNSSTTGLNLDRGGSAFITAAEHVIAGGRGTVFVGAPGVA